MSFLAYHLLWLLAGVLLAALLSAGLTLHLRRRELRREQALALLEALTRYSVWVAAQRGPLAVPAQRGERCAALREVRALQVRCFPGLREAMDTLESIDDALQAFLLRQQQLRQADPEGWLASDPEQHLQALWRRQDEALAAWTRQMRLALAGQAPA